MENEIKKVKKFFKLLAMKHRKLGHREYDPHFAFLNDEKDMLLPAQMGYPFLLLAHGGYQILEGEVTRRWNLTLSVLTHVTDTGDDREKNKALNLCSEILDDIVTRATRGETKMELPWTRGFDLEGATATMIENADDALYGWVIDFSVVLPYCKTFDEDKWSDSSLT